MSSLGHRIAAESHFPTSEIVFAGAFSAGKSMLINALLERELLYSARNALPDRGEAPAAVGNAGIKLTALVPGSSDDLYRPLAPISRTAAGHSSPERAGATATQLHASAKGTASMFQLRQTMQQACRGFDYQNMVDAEPAIRQLLKMDFEQKLISGATNARAI